MPMLLVVLQAGLVWVALWWVLQIHVMWPGALAVPLLLAVTSLLWVVLALTRALGDAGKALARVFLAVQLSSFGGLFALVSPYLHITWVAKAQGQHV